MGALPPDVLGGIVSPTLLALILAASLIGIGLLVLEPKSRNQDVLWALIIFLLMVPGIGLTQPVGVLAAGAALMPPAIYLVYRILRRNKDTKESISDVPKRADLASPHLMIAIGAIGILGFLSVWLKSLKMMGWTALWGAFQSLTASIGQVVTGFAAGVLNYEPLQVKFWIFVVALGLVSGLIALIRSNGLKLAMLFSYGLLGVIYAIGCSDFSNILRNVFRLLITVTPPGSPHL